MNLPEDFIQRIKTQLGKETNAFLKSLKTNPPTSIRANPLKFKSTDSKFTPIPWCQGGCYLEQRPEFSLDPHFHTGSYYVQEAGSMFIDYLLDQCLPSVDEKFTVLDLCAAPGGKSTIILSKLNGKGILIANEVVKKRTQILKDNLIKWGYSNVVVTQNDPSTFVRSGNTFDVVLVDAPCSGEGLFRKDKKAISHWSSDLLKKCELRQSRILNDAKKLIRPGGILIYSTCTFNPGENILQLNPLIEEGHFKTLDLQVPSSWNIERIEDKAIGYQFYPHKTKAEGFFVAALQFEKDSEISYKPGKTRGNPLRRINSNQRSILNNWIEKESQDHTFIDRIGDIYVIPQYHDIMDDKNFNVFAKGTKAGNMKNNVFYPEHALAQVNCLAKSAPKINLSEENVLSYLRGNAGTYKTDLRGWHIVNYQDQNIGLSKSVQGRNNNYYPKHLRIKKVRR